MTSLPLDQPAAPTEIAGLIDIGETFLPVGHMRQISRVRSFDEAGIRGEVSIGADHWVWPEHFPGDPIFPGTLMIEAAGQLLALWAWANGKRGRPRLVRTSAEFHSPVGRNASRLDLEARVRNKRHLYFGSIQVSCAGVPVATVEAILAVLPPSGASQLSVG